MTLFAILAVFAADVSVASFGAVADGSEKCTRAFAAAIAACEKAGGGRVVVLAVGLLMQRLANK